jgi:hypothetical protein
LCAPHRPLVTLWPQARTPAASVQVAHRRLPQACLAATTSGELIATGGAVRAPRVRSSGRSRQFRPLSLLSRQSITEIGRGAGVSEPSSPNIRDTAPAIDRGCRGPGARASRSTVCDRPTDTRLSGAVSFRVCLSRSHALPRWLFRPIAPAGGRCINLAARFPEAFALSTVRHRDRALKPEPRAAWRSPVRAQSAPRASCVRRRSRLRPPARRRRARVR